MENKITYSGPSGVFLLFLAFMCLKLAGFIEWSWWFVTMPLWIPAILVFVVLLFGFIFWGIAVLLDK